MDLSAYIAQRLPLVEDALAAILASGEGPARSLGAAMRYSVFAGGKRLRPLLCLAGCEAMGGEPGRAARTAAALELIHTYSLIHDDLPAMDNDDLRRGRPTCHKQFGEAVAILAGDGLLTEAFSVIAADPGLPAEMRAELVAEIAAAAGARGMVAGQAADMEKEGVAFSREDVEYIHEHKTAALIAAAVVAGAMIGGGSPAQLASVRSYGRNLGLAFQIMDDVLNVTGGRDLGKGVGTDAARGKATYPALVGIEGSRQRARELISSAKAALSEFGERAEALRALAQWVAERER